MRAGAPRAETHAQTGLWAWEGDSEPSQTAAAPGDDPIAHAVAMLRAKRLRHLAEWHLEEQVRASREQRLEDVAEPTPQVAQELEDAARLHRQAAEAARRAAAACEACLDRHGLPL